VGELTGGRLARRDQVFQLGPFFSVVRVTRYFSIAGLLLLGHTFTQQTDSPTTRQSKIDGILDLLCDSRLRQA